MMHRRANSTIRSSLLLLAIAASVSALLGVPSHAVAQVRWAPQTTTARNAPSALSAEALDALLNTGRELETQQRWSEALSHYKDALRSHPEQQSIAQRLNLTRIRYDLARRYADRSFRDALTTLDARQSLNLYGEVLLKIDAHYVTTPQWHNIVGRGATCLAVALDDPNFRQHHLPGVPAATIDAFCQALKRDMAQRAIRSRHDASDALLAAMALTKNRLNLPETIVAMEYISGATTGLDEYSTYLTGDQLRANYSQIDGKFVGLGVELKATPEGVLLTRVIPGSPAAREGLKARNYILSVDGYSAKALSREKAAELLEGVEGSTAEILVATQGGKPLRYVIRRELIEVPSIENAEIIDRNFGIAYLKLTSFQKTTTHELDRSLWSLHRKGMRSLIIDLRNNPGGLLSTSVEVADKFLERGTIVSTRGRNSQEDYTYSAREPGTWRVPLIVLINGDSASASEIFAGAIRDNARGTIIGTKSYGKGSVQTLFRLNLGGVGIRLTTAKFYSPSGRPISQLGVTPDLVVRQVAKLTADGQEVPPAQDPVVEAALTTARQTVITKR